MSLLGQTSEKMNNLALVSLEDKVFFFFSLESGKFSPNFSLFWDGNNTPSCVPEAGPLLEEMTSLQCSHWCINEEPGADPREKGRRPEFPLLNREIREGTKGQTAACEGTQQCRR